VQEWSNAAYAALLAGRAETAVPLLKQALAVEPGAPDLLNNLSKAYEMQGRSDEAETLVRDIHRRFPDYLFARTTLATIHARQGQFDEARELLDPVRSQTKFHITEFAALVYAEFEIAMLRGADDVAKSWLKMMEQASPEHSSLPTMRYQLQLSEIRHGARPQLKLR